MLIETCTAVRCGSQHCRSCSGAGTCSRGAWQSPDSSRCRYRWSWAAAWPRCRIVSCQRRPCRGLGRSGEATDAWVSESVEEHVVVAYTHAVGAVDGQVVAAVGTAGAEGGSAVAPR